jgi:prepilin-type processing-associated H-X9-DG protein
MGLIGILLVCGCTSSAPVVVDKPLEPAHRNLLAIYFCPTRRRPVALTGGPWQSEFQPRAMGDYAGNAGTTSVGGAMGTAYAGDGSDGVVCCRFNASGQESHMTIGQLTDGTSNTIMVGEKNLNPTNYAGSQCGPDDNAGYVGGFQDDVVRWGARGVMDGRGAFSGMLFPPAGDSFGPTETFAMIRDSGRNFWFGSAHHSGAQFVFCDGSVASISYGVDGEVFRRACCRNDRLPLERSW